MIDYDAQRGLWFIFRVSGSVFPKAVCWGAPSAIATIFLHFYCDWAGTMEGVHVLWSGYTFVLGFLIVFRSNQAYDRFWEGATLIQQIRGEWFNAVSSLVAFSNPDVLKREQVEHFQQLLVRLMSMLYCAALQQVCELQDDTFEIISPEGIDRSSLDFLRECPDRCEVILQWIQRLIVESERNGVVKIAPPILSRAFQELSRGMVNLNNVRKIKEIPFPFPYAQMITCMFLVHWVCTPIMASQVIASWWWAAVISFLVTTVFWALLYIALEIDQPFGDDANDLRVREMQQSMNESLLTLLEPLAARPPNYKPRSMDNPRISRSDSCLVPRSPGRPIRLSLNECSTTDLLQSAPAVDSRTNLTQQKCENEQSSDLIVTNCSSLPISSRSDIISPPSKDALNTVAPTAESRPELAPTLCAVGSAPVGTAGRLDSDAQGIAGGGSGATGSSAPPQTPAQSTNTEKAISGQDVSLDGLVQEHSSRPEDFVSHRWPGTHRRRSETSRQSTAPLCSLLPLADCLEPSTTSRDEDVQISNVRSHDRQDQFSCL